MARIACLCYSGSLAHAGRTVTVARELARRGHDVTLCGQPRYLESSLLVDRGELPLEVLHEPDLSAVLAPSRGGADDEQAGAFAFAGAVHDELQLFSRLRPQVVVVDNRRSAIVSAARIGVPSVSLTNASLLGSLSAIDPLRSELADIGGPAVGLPPMEMRQSPALRGRADDEVIPIAARPLPPVLADFIGSQGITPPASVHELSLGTRTLVLDDAGMFPVRDLPGGTRQVGPLTFDVATQMPRWWWSLPEQLPFVYVTFGSTGSAPLLERLIEALIGLGTQLVATTADLIQTVPDGVHACRYLPGSEVARRARLVVCHGGSLTMYQALAGGTPVMAVPTHFEQAIEAIPFVRAGVARALSQVDVAADPASAAATARGMLDDAALHRRTEDAGRRIDPTAALVACADTVEELV